MPTMSVGRELHDVWQALPWWSWAVLLLVATGCGRTALNPSANGGGATSAGGATGQGVGGNGGATEGTGGVVGRGGTLGSDGSGPSLEGLGGLGAGGNTSTSTGGHVMGGGGGAATGGDTRNTGGTVGSVGTADAGACAWPSVFNSTGDESAVGCWASAVSGPADAGVFSCSSAEYWLTCVGALLQLPPDTIPAPDSSLGCRVLPLPTPPDTMYYCCPCGRSATSVITAVGGTTSTGGGIGSGGSGGGGIGGRVASGGGPAAGGEIGAGGVAETGGRIGTDGAIPSGDAEVSCTQMTDPATCNAQVGCYALFSGELPCNSSACTNHFVSCVKAPPECAPATKPCATDCPLTGGFCPSGYVDVFPNSSGCCSNGCVAATKCP